MPPQFQWAYFPPLSQLGAAGYSPTSFVSGQLSLGGFSPDILEQDRQEIPNLNSDPGSCDPAAMSGVHLPLSTHRAQVPRMDWTISPHGVNQSEVITDHRANEVLDDDVKFVELDPNEEHRETSRVAFVYSTLYACAHRIRSRCDSGLCPESRQLWLRMIEGDDSGDDIWLWVDGDEQWIQSHLKIGSFLMDRIPARDLADAQSALRRRIEWVQRTPNPPVVNLSLQEQTRNARIRNADPGQRLAAISWLIRTSQRKEDVDFSHGRTSQSNLGLHDLIFSWRRGTSRILDSIPLFHEQPDAWKFFKENREAMGCRCLEWTGEKVYDWFKMIAWLRQDEGLGVASFGKSSCKSCESKTEQLYDKLYGASHSPNTFPVPLLQALLLLTIRSEYLFDLEPTLTFTRAVLSRSLSQGARHRMEAQLRAYFPVDARDTRFLPWINAYPQRVRDYLTDFLCRPDFWLAPLDPLPSAQTSSECLDASSVLLPAGFADDATEPIIYIGTFAWILACRCISTPSGEDWHRYWMDLGDNLEEAGLTDRTPPDLPGTSACLRAHLKHASSLPDATCFSGARVEAYDDELSFYLAVMMFVKSKNIGQRYEGCPNCHKVYLEAMSRSSLHAGLDVSSALDNPSLSPFEKQLRLNILMEKLATRAAAAGIHLRLLPRNTLGAGTPSRSLAMTATSSSSIVAAGDNHECPEGEQAALANQALMLRVHSNRLLESDRMEDVRVSVTQSQRQPYVEFQPLSASPPSGEHSMLSFLATSGEREIGVIHQARLRGSTQVTQKATDDAHNASELVKPAKIEEIKARLLEMLLDINFPVRHGRLPWSTLQNDLENHGYSIVNWPAEVARKRWNKGINSLDGSEVDTLYYAVMHPDEARRVRFCARASGSADQGHAFTSSQGVGGSKRLSNRDDRGSTLKRIKFRIKTAADFK
ncbi:hypothetical protein BU15DRAFT_79458 [Melanogaster broomeanus]|nr:hypothetical protein BU15DRAFT_79458 [Melanogaster broomeanus]